MKSNEKLIAFSIRVPAAMKERLDQDAHEQKRSLNQQVVFLLEQAIDTPAAGNAKRTERSKAGRA